MHPLLGSSEYSLRVTFVLSPPPHTVNSQFSAVEWLYFPSVSFLPVLREHAFSPRLLEPTEIFSLQAVLCHLPHPCLGPAPEFCWPPTYVRP